MLVKRGHPLWAERFRWDLFAQPSVCFAEPRVLDAFFPREMAPLRERSDLLAELGAALSGA